jgi:hypothetical protein
VLSSQEWQSFAAVDFRFSIFPYHGLYVANATEIPVSRFDYATINRIYRSDTIRYESPEANPRGHKVAANLITVHVVPSGPTRFIIHRGGSSGIA